MDSLRRRPVVQWRTRTRSPTWSGCHLFANVPWVGEVWWWWLEVVGLTGLFVIVLINVLIFFQRRERFEMALGVYMFFSPSFFFWMSCFNFRNWGQNFAATNISKCLAHGSACLGSSTAPEAAPCKLRIVTLPDLFSRWEDQHQAQLPSFWPADNSTQTTTAGSIEKLWIIQCGQIGPSRGQSPADVWRCIHMAF